MSRAGRPASDSPERWRATRAELNRRRHLLTRAAARLYPDAARVGTTALLCRPEWIPSQPLGLDEVKLAWAGHPPPAAVTGAEPASAHVRPLRADGSRYPGYADAMAALDRRRCSTTGPATGSSPRASPAGPGGWTCPWAGTSTA